MTRKNALPVALVCLVLALGTILLYAPAVHFNFVNYEDQLYVMHNPHVNTGFHWNELGWYFGAGYAGNWHPVTWISHAIDCQIFGLNPGGPHAVNLLLHAANAILVFLLLLQMTGAFWRAAMVAALFAWHPLQVESVAWIAERKDVLSALFFLLTLLAYVRYARGSGPFYVVALALFALGLMAKPMVVTLPCVLVLLDFWPLRRFHATNDQFNLRWLGPLLIEKIPFFLLAITSSIITIVAQQRAALPAELADIPLKARVINAEMTYWRYLQHLVWPSDLGAAYPYVFHGPKLQLLGIGVALLALTWLAMRVWRKRPYCSVGWLWFVIMLVPVIDLFHAGAQPMADHYMYLPSIGLFALICWEGCDIACRWPRPLAISGVCAGLALVASLAVSSRQLQIWRDDGTLVARIAEPDANFLAHANYAAYLMHHGQLSHAEAECQAALQIAPSNPTLPALLGEIQRREGKLDEAMKSLRAALDLQPDLAEAHLPLGEILMQQGKVTEAAAEFEIVLQATPDDPVAHWWHGNALLANEDTEDGLKEFATALKLQPNYPEALNDAAWVLATDPRPHFHNPDMAVQMAERACEGSRNSQPRMLGTLAAAYAAAGRFDDAVATAQKAHDLAVKQGDTNLAEQSLQFRDLYRTHQAFLENP
jgi:tetratricopeptide (TPR) repeat protein